MKTDRRTEAAIIAVLDRFRDAVMAKDYNGTLELFSDGEEAFVSGSEEKETASGQQQMKAFFRRIYARPVSYEFNWKTPSVSSKGDVAWVHVDATVRMRGSSDNSVHPYRMSIVLVRRGRIWLIAHYQGSEPVADRKVSDR